VDARAAFRKLQAFASYPVLTQGLKRAQFDFDQLKPYAHFSAEKYRRNLMHEGPAYHALLLCWCAGQRSPIHDHRNSSCAVRVIRGVATETIFDMTDEGRVFPVRTRQLPEGFTCATQDLDIHQISTCSPTPPSWSRCTSTLHRSWSWDNTR
jgi:cysteine dioxygenase